MGEVKGVEDEIRNRETGDREKDKERERGDRGWKDMNHETEANISVRNVL